jgi:hypothetical protein
MGDPLMTHAALGKNQLQGIERFAANCSLNKFGVEIVATKENWMD